MTPRIRKDREGRIITRWAPLSETDQIKTLLLVMLTVLATVIFCAVMIICWLKPLWENFW